MENLNGMRFPNNQCLYMQMPVAETICSLVLIDKRERVNDVLCGRYYKAHANQNRQNRN